MNGILAVLGGLAAIGLAYNLVMLLGWRAERRRRRGGEIRVAAGIYEPFCPTRMRCRCPALPDGTRRRPTERCHLREGLYSATGTIDNQPVMLPFLATIPLAALALLLMLDPILDAPLSWGGLLPEAVRGGIPDWVKWGWAGIGAILAVALASGAFFLPRLRISRQWLVLHEDGRIGARGARLPVFDPRRPFTAQAHIWSDHRGVLIRQDGAELALVLGPVATVAHVRFLNVRRFAPAAAYAVDVGLACGPVERHLARHFRPGPAM